MHRDIIKNGLISGVITAVIFYAFWLYDEKFQNGFLVMEVVYYLLIIAFLISGAFTVKKIRDKEMGGEISIGQTMKLGMTMAMMMAIPLTIFTFFFMVFYGHEFHLNYLYEVGQTAQADEKVFGQYLESAPWAAIETLVDILILGALVYLVAAFFLIKKSANVVKVNR